MTESRIVPPMGGCYYIEYWPINEIPEISHYRGTVRIVYSGYDLQVISGDEAIPEENARQNAVVIKDENSGLRVRVFDIGGKIVDRGKIVSEYRHKVSSVKLEEHDKVDGFPEQSTETNFIIIANVKSVNELRFAIYDDSGIKVEEVNPRSDEKLARLGEKLEPYWEPESPDRKTQSDILNELVPALGLPDTKGLYRLQLQEYDTVSEIPETSRKKNSIIIANVKSVNELRFGAYDAKGNKIEKLDSLSDDKLSWLEKKLKPYWEPKRPNAKMRDEILEEVVQLLGLDDPDGEILVGRGDLKELRNELKGVQDGNGRADSAVLPSKKYRIVERFSTILNHTRQDGYGGEPIVASGDLYLCRNGQRYEASETVLAHACREHRCLVRKYFIRPWLLKHRGRPYCPQPPNLLTPPSHGAPSSKNEKVPIFSREDYACYLERSEVHLDQPWESKLSIPFRIHQFDHTNQVFEEQPQQLHFVAELQKSFKQLGELTDKAPRDTDCKSDSDRILSILKDMRRADPKKEQLDALDSECHDYWGVTFNESKKPVGCFALYHVANHIREGFLEIGKVGDSPAPLSDRRVDRGGNPSSSTDGEVAWGDVYEKIGWKFTVEDPLQIPDEEASQVKSDPTQPWTFGELHSAMQTFRDDAVRNDPSVLDTKWLYHLLCVPQIARVDRGVSYDAAAFDLNGTPREGAAIASDYRFPVLEAGIHPRFPGIAFPIRRDIYQNLEEKEFSKNPKLYFRTAVHEIGHLQGLGHNQADLGFMSTTNVIAFNRPLRRAARRLLRRFRSEEQLSKVIDSNEPAQGGVAGGGEKLPDSAEAKETLQVIKKVLQEDLTIERNRDVLSNLSDLIAAPKEFPQNVALRFHPDDVQRLQHAPDVMIRPGTSFNPANSPVFRPSARRIGSGLELNVEPNPKDIVPLGAPVRINFALKNITDRSSNPQDRHVPASLSLKRGHVSGTVTGPDGIKREFEPLVVEDDRDSELVVLPPGESMAHSITLLHGASGSLFPRRGEYRIEVEVNWDIFAAGASASEGVTRFLVSGSTRVTVSPPDKDDFSHRQTAANLSANRQIFFALVLRPDLDRDLGGTAVALRMALGCEKLRPHFQIIRANQYFEKAIYGISSKWNTVPKPREDSSPEPESKPWKKVENVRWFIDYVKYLGFAMSSIDEKSVLSVSELWRMWKISWVAECGQDYQLRLVDLRDVSDEELRKRLGATDSAKDLSETGAELRSEFIKRTSDDHNVIVSRTAETYLFKFPGEGDIKTSDDPGMSPMSKKTLDAVWQPRMIRKWEETEIIRAAMKLFEYEPEHKKFAVKYKTSGGLAGIPEDEPDKMVEELQGQVTPTRKTLGKILERSRKARKIDLANPEDFDLAKILTNTPNRNTPSK